MKLQTKLSLALLGGMLSVYGASCVVLHYVNAYQLKRQGREFAVAAETEQWAWVERLVQAVQAPLISAMAEGEMDKFEKILVAQRTVPGLQEVSLHDRNGRIAYSSQPTQLKKHLAEELKPALLATTNPLKRQTDSSFELYQPIPATKSCIECHTTWKESEICGVMTMKFSTDPLKAAQTSWHAFEDGLSKRNDLASALTAAVLVALLGALIALTIRFQVTAPLRRIAAILNSEADGVHTAAAQVSSGSQSLADSASEQAASLEQTSASLEQMAATAKNNTDHARLAKDIASETREAAERGVADMQEMNASMSAIRSAGDDISKITKTINEIAFQTNILALNAAVEAARAGEAGQGFAVVADEVRALAQRSAAAATETAAKIAATLAKTAQGSGLAGKIGSALDDIVTRARKLDELAASVATASKQEGGGITQLNSAIKQMDAITQNNAANAEESAAAAEELNAQAETMKQSVNELLQLVGGHSQPVTNRPAPSLTQAKHYQSPPPKRSSSTNGDGNGHAPLVLAKAGAAHRDGITPADDFKDF